MLYKYLFLVKKAMYIFYIRIFFALDDALIGNGQIYPNLLKFIPTVLHYVIQTLIEEASVEIINIHYRSNYFKARK